jgi:hypothetical protein
VTSGLSRIERFEARAARRRDSHSYGVVLALIFVSFLFTAFAPSGSTSLSVLVLLESATLAAALWTSGLGPLSLRVGFVAVGVVAALVELLTAGKIFEGVVGILSGLLVVAIIVVLARGVLHQGEVNAQSVIGAICVYLLVGMLFQFLYGAVAVLGDGPFFAQGTDGTQSIRLYFSFVTLATLGYGDYTAATDLGRTLAVTEALLGQLYLVTVLAVLVSQLGRGRGA